MIKRLKNTTDKEIKNMSRTELVEIIYELKIKEEQLTEENKLLKEELKQRNIKIAKAGSIAEAALSLNQIFEVAQQAAEDYLNSVRKIAAISDEGDCYEKR